MSEKKPKPEDKKKSVDWDERDPGIIDTIQKALVKKKRDINDIQK